MGGIIGKLSFDPGENLARPVLDRLWSRLMLEYWFRQFVDGDAAAEEPDEYAVVKAA
jgi:hypothetical protein